MSEEVKKKFEEFAKRLDTDEDVFKLIDEMSTYIEGVSDTTNNPFTKSELTGLSMDFSIIRVILLGFNKIKERFRKMDAQLNSGLERINKLEQKKPLDDPESMK